MALDPMHIGLITIALVIATVLYATLIRRRAAERNYRGRGVDGVLDEYGRSALP